MDTKEREFRKKYPSASHEESHLDLLIQTHLDSYLFRPLLCPLPSEGEGWVRGIHSGRNNYYFVCISVHSRSLAVDTAA